MGCRFFHGLQMRAAFEKRNPPPKKTNHKANTLPQKNELQKISKVHLKTRPSKPLHEFFFCFFRNAFRTNINSQQSSNHSPPFFPEQLSPCPLVQQQEPPAKGNVSELTYPTKREKNQKIIDSKVPFFGGICYFPQG